MVPLNLDDPVLDRSAGSAAFFELSGKRPDPVIIQGHPRDDSNSLPAAPFRFAPDPNDSIATRRSAFFSADTAVNRLGTLRADPSGIGRVDKPGV